MKPPRANVAESPAAAPVDLEFFPTAQSVRRIKLLETIFILIGTAMMCLAVGLTRDPGMYLLGLVGVVIISMILMHELHVYRKAVDPVWLAAHAVRVSMTATGIVVSWGEREPQVADWSELKSAWQTRMGLIVERRAGGRNVRIVTDLFTMKERRELRAEISKRISLAAPKD